MGLNIVLVIYVDFRKYGNRHKRLENHGILEKNVV